MFKFFALSSLFLLCAAFSGCAPGLGSTIELGTLESAEVEALDLTDGGEAIKLNVLQFSDSRKIEAVAQVDGRMINAGNDVPAAAQRIFEQRIKSAGAKLAHFDVPSVRGAVTEWRIVVAPGFPSSKLEAGAGLLIELLDASGRPIHKAQYSGEYQEEHPFMSEGKVREALTKVMVYAVEEVLKDPRFLNKLATLSGTREAIGNFPAGDVNELAY